MSNHAAGSNKPKGLILYYSGSGNTRLACRYIAANIDSVDFELFNMVGDRIPDLRDCAIVGFAVFTDFLAPPQLVKTYLENFPLQQGRPAFVFNTYGFINGRTPTALADWVSARGFKVVAGHSLHTPESYPPMVADGHGNEQAPNEKELKQFKRFVAELEAICRRISLGQEVDSGKIPVGILGVILPTLSRTRSRDDMGIKYVDAELCKECHTCEKLCPYKAIKLDPKPVFDMGKCYGCWSCFNHCPNKAIYTKKFRGRGHYPRPIDSLKQKLATDV